MFIGELNDAEVETLILALRFWRHHRHGELRRGDHAIHGLQLDMLLAKLGAATLSTLPPDDERADLYPR